MGAVEQALDGAKAKFDYIVDTEKTTDACFNKTATCTTRPSQARRQKDEEEWVVRTCTQVSCVVSKGEMEERMRQRRV